MSKRDIETVCTLAAHLAHQNWRRYPMEGGVPVNELAAAVTAAEDAMRLQRLGRSALRALENYYDSEAGASPGVYTERELQERWRQIEDDADAVLAPYGLTAKCHDHPFRAECLVILGLPGNTLGGDQDGFGI